MTKKELQIFSIAVVTESQLPKQAKLQILEWLQHEASKIDIMGFLMDGRIRHFDEDTQQIVVDRFMISEAGGRIAKLRKTYMSQAGSGGGLNLMWLAYRAVRAQFDKCTRGCGTFEFNTSRRQHCMIQCKVDKAKKELAAAQKSKDEKQIIKKPIM